MKRFLLFLALVSVAHAVGSVQQNVQNIGSNVFAFSFNWVGDSVNGSVPATVAQGSIQLQGYRVISMETTPGSPAPTNGYSITLIDSAGVDIMAGASAALSNTAAQSFAGSPTAPPLYGSFAFTVTGNSVASAKGSAIVYLAPLNQVIGLSPTSPSFPAQGANLIYASPNGASGSPGFRALAIPGDLGANVVPVVNGGTGVTSAQGVGDTKVQLAGTNSGTSGASLCNDANGGTTTTCPSVFPSASAQLQYLRTQPNTGNNTTLAFSAIPIVNGADYNWAQTLGPGQTLTGGGGAQNITLTPCPLGIVTSGTFATPVYFSGGTGAAESLRPSGGTCTSGAASGTITVTPTNSHTGAWSAQSSTVGITEAIAANPKREIHLPLGTYTMQDCIILDSTKPLIITGDGYDPNSGGTGTQINFASVSTYAAGCNGAAISDYGSGFPINPITLRALTVVGNGTTTPVVNGIGLSSVTRVTLDNVFVSGFAGNCLFTTNAFEIYVNNRSYFQLCGLYGGNLTGTTNLVSIKDSTFAFNSRTNGNGNLLINAAASPNQSSGVYLQGVDDENAGQNPFTTTTVAFGLYINNVSSVSVIGCFFEGNVGGSPNTQVMFDSGTSSVVEIGNVFSSGGTSAAFADLYGPGVIAITSYSNTFFGANALRSLTSTSFGTYTIGPDTCLSSSTECTTHFRSLGATGTTGAGSAALGSNSPAVTNTAPFTWLKLIGPDGSTIYIPAWK